MENMDISIIIPLHEYNETIEKYLDKAIESITNQETHTMNFFVYIVHPKNLDTIKIYDNVNYFINEGKTDYQSQVNFAANKINTPYFTVLEFDDEFSLNYLRIIEKYINSFPNIDVFLPIIIETDTNNNGIRLTNHAAWSQQLVGENGEVGYFNLNLLKQFTDFKLSGAVIKTNEFLNIGGYKSNIKLTFMYEFLLRSINNIIKIYTVPKILYKHLSDRENSLFDNYGKTMSMEERKFWFETATNESNFINDRPIDLSRLKVNSVTKPIDYYSLNT